MDVGSADLTRREADIALRFYRPRQPDLIAKKIGALTFGIFASETYIAEHGRPEALENLGDHHMVLPDNETMRFYEPYFHKKGIALNKVCFRSNSVFALLNATVAGFGIGIYSCAMASQYPELINLFPGQQGFQPIDIWLVTHSDLKRSPRIRAMYDFLSDLIKAKQDILSGCDGPIPY